MNPSRLRRHGSPGALAIERQRMQAIGEFRAQEAIDQPMALDPALAFEFGRHDPDAIMRAAAFARSGMSRMTVGLVDDVETLRIEPAVKRATILSCMVTGFRPPVKRIATLHIVCWAAG